RVDRALDHELLDLEQDGLALRAVKLARLLTIKLVDVRVAAVGEDSALHEVGFDARRRIAEGARPGLDDVAVLLLAEFLDEGGPLDRPQLGADADRQKIVDRDLADIGVGAVAEIVAGIETVAKSGLGKELFGPGGIEF